LAQKAPPRHQLKRSGGCKRLAPGFRDATPAALRRPNGADGPGISALIITKSPWKHGINELIDTLINGKYFSMKMEDITSDQQNNHLASPRQILLSPSLKYCNLLSLIAFSHCIPGADSTMPALIKAIVLAFTVAAAAIPHGSPTSSPSATTSPAPSASPPPPTPDTKELFEDLFTSPSALGRFRRLLTDPATGGLLPGPALRSRIVFDYNIGPSDKGGKITAAVAGSFPILVGQDISTVTAFLNPCRYSDSPL
jgi:hypothetical protein